MRSPFLTPAVVVTALLALGACSDKREVTATTGTAEATVTTEAPPSQVPDIQLQQEAQQAATAASTPVDGSGPVTNIAPKPPAQ